MKKLLLFISLAAVVLIVTVAAFITLCPVEVKASGSTTGSKGGVDFSISYNKHEIDKNNYWYDATLTARNNNSYTVTISGTIKFSCPDGGEKKKLISHWDVGELKSGETKSQEMINVCKEEPTNADFGDVTVRKKWPPDE